MVFIESALEVSDLRKTYTRKLDDLMPLELKFHHFGEGSPKVFFSAGLHGGEATGIYAAEKVLAFLEENELLKGSVKLLPVANVAAFRRLQRTAPYDELDLNRIFPGKQGATPSLALADMLWQEAQAADYIVDLHCCGTWGSSYTLALYKDFEYAKDLAKMLDIPIVIQSGGTRGQMFVEASYAGIPAVIIELPGGGKDAAIDFEAGERCFQALVNMLRLLGMVSGDAKEPTPTFYGKTKKLLAWVDGLFVPHMRPETTVEEGDVMGTLNGEPVLAPFKGIATRVRPGAYVFKGMPIVHVAPLA